MRFCAAQRRCLNARRDRAFAAGHDAKGRLNNATGLSGLHFDVALFPAHIGRFDRDAHVSRLSAQSTIFRGCHANLCGTGSAAGDTRQTRNDFDTFGTAQSDESREFGVTPTTGQGFAVCWHNRCVLPVTNGQAVTGNETS
jgi:hypothetical protein